MRVFVTGASGFIGSAVVQNLIKAGHHVIGLARNDEAASAIERVGAEAHRGELADTDGLASAARASDGVIHTAFGHDFSAYAAAVETDRRAVEAMGGALEGSGKPLVIASGTLMVSHARPGTENDAPVSLGIPRAASEATVLAAAGRGVRGIVVRLAPAVHDRSRAGLVTQMIALAREKGVSAFIGSGANRWPAVHRLDAARLFWLALERAKPGARLHAVAEDGITHRAIAEAIGRGLRVPVRSVAPDDAPAHFGWLALSLSLDNPTSSTITRDAVGWSPQEAGLLADLSESAGAGSVA